MIRPQNCVPSIKDKKITKWWDLSAGMALAAGTGVIFHDNLIAYQVISVAIVPTVTLTSTATSMILGTLTDDDHFVVSVDVAATAGNRVVGVVQTLTLTSTPLLPAGIPLIALSTGTANTGEALITITLRPVELARGNISKRPGASAQSAT